MDRLVTTKQLAEILGCQTHNVYQRMKKKGAPLPVKIEKGNRQLTAYYSEKEAMKYLAVKPLTPEELEAKGLTTIPIIAAESNVSTSWANQVFRTYDGAPTCQAVIARQRYYKKEEAVKFLKMVVTTPPSQRRGSKNDKKDESELEDPDNPTYLKFGVYKSEATINQHALNFHKLLPNGGHYGLNNR